MKLVKAIIKPERFEFVKKAMEEKGFKGMTITEVKGFGRQRRHKEVYRGTEYQVDLVPKIQLGVVVDSGQVEQGVDLIRKTANTGKIGDGKPGTRCWQGIP